MDFTKSQERLLLRQLADRKIPILIMLKVGPPDRIGRLVVVEDLLVSRSLRRWDRFWKEDSIALEAVRSMGQGMLLI